MVTRVRRSSPGPHLRLRPTRTLSETPRPHHGRGYGRCRRCGRTRRAHTCLQNRPEGGFAQAPTACQLLVDHTPEEPRGCTDATTCVQTSSLSRDRQHLSEGGGGGGRLIALVHLLPGGRVIDRSGPTFVFTPNGARSCPFFAPREWLPVPPEVSPRRILHFRQRPVDLLRGQDARIVTLCEDTTGCPRGAALRLVGWSLTRVRRWWRVEFPGPCGMNYPECLMAGFLWLCTSSCAKRGS